MANQTIRRVTAKRKAAAKVLLSHPGSERRWPKESNIMKKVPDRINSSEVLVFIGSNKVDSHYVVELKDFTNLPDETISSWYDLNVKTYRTYKTPHLQLGKHVQEQTVMLLTLMKHGREVFGDVKKFIAWLEGKNFYFDNKSPGAFLNTINGIKLVDDKLTAMEYGDNA